MIPLRDDAPRSSFPGVTYFLIALNVLIFLYQWSLPPRPEMRFEASFGFIPYRVDLWLSGAPAMAAFLPAFTSMFLHAGWLHLIGNMWFLYLFGDNVEDRLGHFRYLVTYLICGFAAAFTHFVFNMHSKIPTVGASGAIAGVLGAYFVLFPNARVLTWVFVFVVQLPAWLVLGWWFVLQFLSGAATSISPAVQANPVAVWAHVGGFITGMLLVKIIPARKSYYAFEEY
jgi:membrane associated rhomboid family serine protease